MSRGYTVMELLAVLCLTFIILMVFCLPIVNAYFEAEAYNRITGANVSTWDAIWLDLRVQDTPK